jgi:hypothetical protein
MSKIPRGSMKKSFVDKLAHGTLVSWSHIKPTIAFIKGQFIAKIRYIGCLVSVTFFLLSLQFVACSPTTSPSPASANTAVTSSNASSSTTVTSNATAASPANATSRTGPTVNATSHAGPTATATSPIGPTVTETSPTGPTVTETSPTGPTVTETSFPPTDPKDYTISVEGGGGISESAYPGEPSFTPFMITVTNVRSYPITWSVMSDSNWLSLDSQGDTLPPGMAEDHKVIITAPNDLQIGMTYTGKLQFMPFDPHTPNLQHYSQVDLTVTSPPGPTVTPQPEPTVTEPPGPTVTQPPGPTVTQPPGPTVTEPPGPTVTPSP